MSTFQSQNGALWDMKDDTALALIDNWYQWNRTTPYLDEDNETFVSWWTRYKQNIVLSHLRFLLTTLCGTCTFHIYFICKMCCVHEKEDIIWHEWWDDCYMWRVYIWCIHTIDCRVPLGRAVELKIALCIRITCHGNALSITSPVWGERASYDSRLSCIGLVIGSFMLFL